MTKIAIIDAVVVFTHVRPAAEMTWYVRKRHFYETHAPLAHVPQMF